MLRLNSDKLKALRDDLLYFSMLKKNPPILVVGAGIAGSVTALKLKAQGHNVILITKYPFSARSQRVRLNKERYLDLSDITHHNTHDEKDVHFFRKMGTTIQVPLKTIEKFFERKIKAARIPFLDDAAGTLAEINTKEYIVSIHLKATQEFITIPFRHIFDASGTARAVFSMLEDECRPVIESLGSPLHAAQGAVTLVRDGKFVTNWSWADCFVPLKGDLEELKKLGWEENRQPLGGIIINYTGRKFYLFGEIPSEYLTLPKEQSRKEIIHWFKTILCKQCKIPSEQFTVLNKNHKEQQYYFRFDCNREIAKQAVAAGNDLTVTGFKIKLTRLTNPIVDLDPQQAGEHVIAAVGDAYQSSYYHEAHGANHAILSGSQIGDCINKHGIFDVDKYRKFTEMLKSSYLKLIPANLIKEEIPEERGSNSNDGAEAAERVNEIFQPINSNKEIDVKNGTDGTSLHFGSNYTLFDRGKANLNHLINESINAAYRPY